MAQLFQGLIRPNARVRIENLTASKDAVGGTEYAYATVAADVPVLVTQVRGARDGRFGGENNVLSFTATGEHDALGRTDTRLYFESCAVPGLTGKYARANAVEPHAPGLGGLQAGRITIRCETVQE